MYYTSCTQLLLKKAIFPALLGGPQRSVRKSFRGRWSEILEARYFACCSSNSVIALNFIRATNYSSFLWCALLPGHVELDDVLLTLKEFHICQFIQLCCVNQCVCVCVCVCVWLCVSDFWHLLSWKIISYTRCLDLWSGSAKTVMEDAGEPGVCRSVECDIRHITAHVSTVTL